MILENLALHFPSVLLVFLICLLHYSYYGCVTSVRFGALLDRCTNELITSKSAVVLEVALTYYY